MRRALIGLLAVAPFALGAGVAQAHAPRHWRFDQGNGPAPSPVVAVAGTVTGVNASASSFTANAFLPRGEGYGWHHARPARPGLVGHVRRQSQTAPAAPTTTPVTITTTSATRLRIGHEPNASLSDLATGDRFVALFKGTPGESLSQIVSGPALAVYAHPAPKQHQLYAFVGTVKSIDTSAGKLTVQVANSFPSGLVPSGSNPATFTVSSSTLVLGGPSAQGLQGGSLGDVKVGDIVAGGETGPAGETLSQVEASPLQVLVDFPSGTGSPSTTASAARHQARQSALTQALDLCGYHAGSRSRGHHGARTHTSGRRGSSAARPSARRG